MHHLGPDKVPSAPPAAFEDVSNRTPKFDTQALRRLLYDDSGQDLIEYALVAALVGLGSVLAMKTLKNNIGNTFNILGNDLTNAVA